MKQFFFGILALALSASACAAAPISTYPNATTPLSGVETMIGTQPPGTNGKTVNITPAMIAAYATSQMAPPAAISPLQPPYNCIGDGVADDTLCMQAALTAAAHGVLNLGPHLYKTGSLTSAATVTILAPQGGNGLNQYSSCSAGFIPLNANENLLTLTGSGSLIEGVCFQMGNSLSSNTAGYAVKFGVGTNFTIQDSQINYPFIGVEITGNGNTQNVKSVVQRNVIAQVNNGGAGVRVGANSTFQNTVDTFVTENAIIDTSSNTGVGTLILDSGGILYRGNDTFQLGVGLKIFPGVSQRANGFFYDILGDSSYQNDAIIDENGGIVAFAYFTNTWTSGANAQDFLMQQTNGSGFISQIYLVHHHAQMHGGGSVPQFGIDIEGGTRISIQDSDFCLQSTAPAGSAAVKVGNASVNYFGFTGDKTNNCGAALPVGLQMVTGVGIGVVQTNQLSNAVVPILWTPTAANVDTFILKDNMGIDNIVPTIASASALVLPINPEVQVSGNTSINTIGGGWSSREVDLVSSNGGLTLNAVTGGACVAITLSALQSVHLRYNAAATCWVHQ